MASSLASLGLGGDGSAPIDREGATPAMLARAWSLAEASLTGAPLRELPAEKRVVAVALHRVLRVSHARAHGGTYAFICVCTRMYTHRLACMHVHSLTLHGQTCARPHRTHTHTYGETESALCGMNLCELTCHTPCWSTYAVHALTAVLYSLLHRRRLLTRLCVLVCCRRLTRQR